VGRGDPEFARRLSSQGALVLAALGPLTLGPWPFAVALLAFTYLSAREVRAVLSTRCAVPAAAPVLALALVLAAYAARAPGLGWTLARAGSSALALALPWWFRGAQGALRARLAPLVAIAFPAASVAAAAPLLDQGAQLFPRVAFLYGVLEVNDSVAFLVGRAFGRRRLAPALSPNKTWAGFAAGLLAATATGGALAFCLPGWSMAHVLLVAFALAGFGVLADLSASALKRALEVKDYGRALGPHGGLFDAYDAWLLGLGPWAVVLALSE
jgi:phosphatidate cytidylyltransferase